VPLVSAVALVVPAVGEVLPDTVLDASGHVRPQFENGGLVLLVRPGPAGTVVSGGEAGRARLRGTLRHGRMAVWRSCGPRGRG
jgi:hypothetical protein